MFGDPIENRHAVVAVTSGMVLFGFVPIYMIGLSPGDYAFIDIGKIFALTLPLTLLYSLLLIALNYLGKRRLGERNPLPMIGIFVLCWICCSGFLLPSSVSMEMAEAQGIPLNFKNMATVAIVAAGMTLAARTSAFRYINIFLIVLVTTACVPLLPNIFKQSMRADGSARIGIVTLSPAENIIVLSLDGLPGTAMRKALNGDSEYADYFKDFLSYENVVATSPATVVSLAAEVHGNRDFKTVATTETSLLKKLDHRDLLINSPDHDVYTYGEYNSFNLNPDRIVRMGELREGQSLGRKWGDVFDFYDIVFARVGSRYLVKLFAPFRQRFLGIIISNINEDVESPDIRLLLNHRGPNWDKKLVGTIDDYRGFIENLRVGSNLKPAIRYLHFPFTHFPIDFDEKCNYRGDDLDWITSNQNEGGIGGEIACSLELVAEFLQKLESLDVYDKSLIVIKSDHGKPGNYYSSSPANLCLNDQCTMGLDRYRPMLKIKPRGRRAGEETLIDKMVLLDDLAKTLCFEAKGNGGCDRYAGLNLLDPLSEAPQGFFINVAANGRSSHMFDTLISVKLERSRSIIESMKANSKIKMSSP